MSTVIVIFLSAAILSMFILAAIYVVKSLDKENPIAEQEEPNEFLNLKMEVSDIVFANTLNLSLAEMNMVSTEIAKFITERNMAFYRNGFENGMTSTEKTYSEQEILDFTQSMISQYKSGNTNIEQLALLKESLRCVK